LKIVSDALVVNAKNNGIRDVILFPDAKSFDASKGDPSVKEVVAKPVLDNKNCRFEPHVVVLKSGQTLVVKNSDKTGHNASFPFFNNDPKNQQIPAGGQQDFKVEKAEPGPIPVSCGSHSWMKAFVVIQDHPFVGVSNQDGVVEIKGLPVGKLSMKIVHESGKFKDLTIHGKTYPVKKGAFEIELKPGKNDLGKIELSSDELKS
jgi:plastocyanin